MKIHIVQKGDTLWEISKKYGVDFEELKQLNSHISSPDMIMPGMKIKIPSSKKVVKKETAVKESGMKEMKKETKPKTHSDIASKPIKPVMEEVEQKQVKVKMPQMPILGMEVKGETKKPPPELPSFTKEAEVPKMMPVKESTAQPSHDMFQPMPHQPMAGMPMCCHVICPCCVQMKHNHCPPMNQMKGQFMPPKQMFPEHMMMHPKATGYKENNSQGYQEQMPSSFPTNEMPPPYSAGYVQQTNPQYPEFMNEQIDANMYREPQFTPEHNIKPTPPSFPPFPPFDNQGENN